MGISKVQEVQAAAPTVLLGACPETLWMDMALLDFRQHGRGTGSFVDLRATWPNIVLPDGRCAAAEAGGKCLDSFSWELWLEALDLR